MASQHQQPPISPTSHHHQYTGYLFAYQPPGQLYHDPAFTPLGYQVQPVPQQPPQGPAFVTSGFHRSAPRHQHLQLPLRTRQQARRARTMTTDAPQPPAMSEEELAELQKLSNEYEPEAKGPLVGLRQPSTNIATEYATADPVLQAKTASLPEKYSYYRTVRGDGMCGWRAIAFGYFETLIHLGDSNKFLEEETRLRSLVNTCNAAGFSEMVLEEFSDMTFHWLRNVANGLQDGTAEDVLHNAFNDTEVQNYIITHMKMLTGAWMKTRSSEYSPWLIQQTVDEFVTNCVLPMQSHLEHVSLIALKDVLLAPAGIHLEVMYLDRSQGDEVNMHRFSPTNAYDIGTIRLLYRPGHYDMLYMPQDLPPASVPAVVPTYLQYASQPYNEPVFDLGYSDFMTSIPGMSYAHPHQGWLSSSSYASSDFFAAPTPVQQCPQPVATPSVLAAQPRMQSAPVYVAAAPTDLFPPPTQISEQLVIRTVPQANISSHSSFQIQSAGPFRPSMWQLETDLAQPTPLQTSIFRNSHFNTAHFLNPEFQPEEWHPEDEYVNTTPRHPKHRNSG